MTSIHRAIHKYASNVAQWRGQNSSVRLFLFETANKWFINFFTQTLEGDGACRWTKATHALQKNWGSKKKKILSWVQCNTQKFVLILTLAVLYQQQPKLPSEKLLLSYLLDILWVCANVRVCAWSVDVQEGERVGKGGFFAQFLWQEDICCSNRFERTLA